MESKPFALIGVNTNGYAVEKLKEVMDKEKLNWRSFAEKRGLMLLIAGPDVVRLAPALVVSDEQIATADRIMREAAEEFLAAN